MTCRGTLAAWMIACLTAGLSGHVLAQSALPLKGTVDEDATAAGPAVLRPETSLEVSPLEPPDRPRLRRAGAAADPYAPTGIGTGGLRLYPSITAGAVYSSNVNSSPSHPKSDIGWQLKPTLKLESDWVRHALTVGLDGNLVRYSGSPRFDTSNLNVSERLRLDVRRHTTAEINSGYILDEPGGDDPTEHSLTGTAALTHDFGPMSARISAGTTTRLYDDLRRSNGSVEDNGDRDYVETSLGLRTTYNEYGTIRPYVEASLAPRTHLRELDRHGINRDSTGYALTSGLELDAGPIWAGDLGLTYLHRSYDSASLGSAGAFGLTGNVTWSPNDLTKVVMTAGTALDETTQADMPATATWTAGVGMTYGLRDNIDLLAGAAIEIEDTGRGVDTTYDGSIGVAWKLNPMMAWTAGYDLTWFDAGTTWGDYVEHRLRTGVTLSR